MTTKRPIRDLAAVFALLALAFAAAGCREEGRQADAGVDSGGPDSGLLDVRPPDMGVDRAPMDAAGDPPPVVDAGGDQTDLPQQQPDAAGACNDLALPPLIGTDVRTGARPANEQETGGTLQEGSYVLTRFTIYDVPPNLATTVQAGRVGLSLRIRDGVMDSLFVDDFSGLGPDRLSERMTVIGNMLHLTGICPDSTTVDDSLFTTDGQTLRMSQIDPDTGFELVVELTRRP